MTLEDFTILLQEHFPAASIQCTGNLYHVTVHIIDVSFEGKKTLQRHQSIYRILKPLIDDQTLHAVTLLTKTPAEAVL